jgi:ribosome-binding protein aMBF1 (putative translation factor)
MWYLIRYHLLMDASRLLRTARQRAGLGLRELARRAGTSHATLHAYESGAVEPRIDTLERIVTASGFGLELSLVPGGADREARRAKGLELEQVLDLAGQFPARHHPTLRAPVFGRPG